MILENDGNSNGIGLQLTPFVKWLVIFVIVPLITILIKLIIGIYSFHLNISCTDILGMSISLAIASFVDILGSSMNKRGNYLVAIAGVCFFSVVVFSICAMSEIRNVQAADIVLTFFAASINHLCCLKLTYLKMKSSFSNNNTDSNDSETGGERSNEK